MTSPPLPAKLPPIFQLAYLVPHLEAAAEFWARHMGVGPFAKLPHIAFVESSYRSAPLDLDLSIALAWRGDVQIELMQQHSPSDSIFTDFAPAEGGFHHAGIRSADIEADSATLIAAGLTLLQRNLSGTGTETRFFGGSSLGIVELIHTPGGPSPLSEKLKAAAGLWDGRSVWL